MTNTLPLLISQGIVVFPHLTVTNLQIRRLRLINAVFKARTLNTDNPQIVVSLQVYSEGDRMISEDVYQVGVLCRILDVKTNNDGSLALELKGEKRVVITDVSVENSENGKYFAVKYDLLNQRDSTASDLADVRKIWNKIEENYVACGGSRSLFNQNDSSQVRELLNNANYFVDAVAGCLLLKHVALTKLQLVLSETSTSHRLAMISNLLDDYVFPSSSLVIDKLPNKSLDKSLFDNLLISNLKIRMEETEKQIM